MFNKKNYLLNCDVCDTRKMKEEEEHCIEIHDIEEENEDEIKERRKSESFNSIRKYPINELMTSTVITEIEDPHEKELKKEGIKEIKRLKKSIKKTDGEFFLFGGEIKELKSLVNLENELKVFERVVI